MKKSKKAFKPGQTGFLRAAKAKAKAPDLHVGVGFDPGDGGADGRATVTVQYTLKGGPEDYGLWTGVADDIMDAVMMIADRACARQYEGLGDRVVVEAHPAMALHHPRFQRGGEPRRVEVGDDGLQYVGKDGDYERDARPWGQLLVGGTDADQVAFAADERKWAEEDATASSNKAVRDTRRAA